MHTHSVCLDAFLRLRQFYWVPRGLMGSLEGVYNIIDDFDREYLIIKTAGMLSSNVAYSPNDDSSSGIQFEIHWESAPTKFFQNPWWSVGTQKIINHLGKDFGYFTVDREGRVTIHQADQLVGHGTLDRTNMEMLVKVSEYSDKVTSINGKRFDLTALPAKAMDNRIWLALGLYMRNEKNKSTHS